MSSNQEIIQAIELTDIEKSKAIEISQKINLKEANNILSYGSKQQDKINNLVKASLNRVALSDNSLIEKKLIGLIKELGVNKYRKQGIISRFFNRVKTNFSLMVQDADRTVEGINTELVGFMAKLDGDTDSIDKLGTENLAYCKELTILIEAGQKALLSDLDDIDDSNRNLFEKRIYDLILSRNLAQQVSVQLKSIKFNNLSLMNKIQSTINTVLPIWKTQLVLNTYLENSKDALEAQKIISDMTNELITENSANMKDIIVESSRQVERGIIDIKTLKDSSNNIISCLQEIKTIVEKERGERDQNINEIRQIESKMKALANIQIDYDHGGERLLK